MPDQRPWLRLCWRCTRTAAGACTTATCWVLWALLSVLLVTLVVVLVRHEIAVPDFVLRRIESKLQFAHLSARFGRSTIDPQGGLLLEDVRIFGQGIQEPLATARAVRIETDFWAVAAGDFDVRSIQVADLRLDCPAIVSPTGTSVPVVRGAQLVLERDGRDWRIPAFSLQAARLLATGRVSWSPPRTAGPRRQLPADLLKQYVALSRRALDALAHTERLDHARLDVDVRFPAAGLPGIQARLSAAQVELPGGWVARGLELRAESNRARMESAPLVLQVAADTVQGPDATELRRLRARGEGHLQLAPLRWSGAPAAVEAALFRRGEVVLETPCALIATDRWPLVSGRLACRVKESAVTIDATVDSAQRSGEIAFSGRFTPRFLNETTDRLAAVRRSRILAQMEFGGPAEVDGRITLGAGADFRQAVLAVRAGATRAYGVDLIGATAEVTVDRRRLQVERVELRRPDADVRGSYTMDLATQDYRFLLRGGFYPMSIAPWFSGWWGRFWADFSFGQPAPQADVDILGRWRSPELSIVYGHADVRPLVLRGVAFDRMRTEFFIRPEHYDILRFDGTRDTLQARGTFTRHDDSATHQPVWITFDFASRFPLAEGARLLGEEALRTVAPYEFAVAPELTARGRIDFPGGVAREKLEARVAGNGPFRFHGFPLEQPHFVFTMDAGTIDVPEIDAVLAGGRLRGRARVDGPPQAQQLDFAGRLENADLNGAIAAWTDFRAHDPSSQVAATPQALSQSLGTKGRIDLDLRARGPLDDLLGLTGQGSARIREAELGEIQLLGPLSRVLRGTLLGFTSLRFTDAATEFTIARDRLRFHQFDFTGPTAALDGKGDYSMASGAVDFKVTLHPFRESGFPIFGLLGVVLEPISRALEVKLTGTIDKPRWEFVAGPTNLFGGKPRGAEAPAGAPALPAPPAPAAPATPPAS